MVPNELLEKDIAGWEHQLSQISISQLTKATLMTVLYVAKEILPQKAVLLPEASDVFIEAFGAPLLSDLHLNVEEGTIKFTSQWLLIVNC